MGAWAIAAGQRVFYNEPLLLPQTPPKSHRAFFFTHQPRPIARLPVLDVYHYRIFTIIATLPVVTPTPLSHNV